MIPSDELALGRFHGPRRIRRVVVHHDGVQLRVGQVGEGEHQSIDLEHLRAGHVLTPLAFGIDHAQRHPFRWIHPRSVAGR
jgi:hypothetical protein